LEAMAAGKPIIATSIGSQREVASQADMACLVRPADALALGEAILRLSGDQGRMARLGISARALYESRYTADRMLHSYRQLYFDLLSAKCPLEATKAAQGCNGRQAGSQERLSQNYSGLVPAPREPKGGGV
jgi:hypothetical protein